MSAVAADPLVPVQTFFPAKDARWISDACRGVKPRRDQPRRAPVIPNAIKVGRVWMMRDSDFAAFVSGVASRVGPTVDQAAADLRAQGVT